MRLDDIVIVNLRFFDDKWRQRTSPLTCNLETATNFTFNRFDCRKTKFFACDGNTQRNRGTGFLLPIGAQILQKMETVTFPSKTMLVDGNALRNVLAQEPIIDLVKKRIFDFWGVFVSMGIPKLEQKRCSRICPRKRRREFRVKRTRRRGEQKRTAAVPDRTAATETTVRLANFRIDLRANLCNIQFAPQNHFVERLHVGKRHLPIKGRILETADQGFVDERIVGASGNTESKLHRGMRSRLRRFEVWGVSEMQ